MHANVNGDQGQLDIDPPVTEEQLASQKTESVSEKALGRNSFFTFR